MLNMLLLTAGIWTAISFLFVWRLATAPPQTRPYSSAEPVCTAWTLQASVPKLPIIAEPFKSREHRRDVSREEFEAFLRSYARPLEVRTPLNTESGLSRMARSDVRRFAGKRSGEVPEVL